MTSPSLPSRPMHSPRNSTGDTQYQPKHTSFTTFFKRYSYAGSASPGHRDKRVAPADALPHQGTQTVGRGARRRARSMELLGENEHARLQRSHRRAMHPWRLKVAEFMRHLAVELFFVIIVLLYGAFVTFQLTIDESDMSEADHKVYTSVVDTTDIIVCSILMLELLLKLFAFGWVYLKDFWILFDAIVVIASFVMGIVAATGSQSTVLLRILRLRIVLRILRILVVFERLKQQSRSLKRPHKLQMSSPVELVLNVLRELQYHPALRKELRQDIHYAIDAIKNNRLYNADEGILAGEGVDDATQQWLIGEVLKGGMDADALLSNGHSNDNVHDKQNVKSAGGKDQARAKAKMSIRSSGSISHDITQSGTRKVSLGRGATMKDLMPTLDTASEFELENLLQSADAWVFDIFRVQMLSGGNALSYLGYFLLKEYASTIFQTDSFVFVHFLMEIQRGYVDTNAYHNAIHAADVMQTVYYFLMQPELSPFLRPLDKALALVAAAIHDFKHDGFNNSFHISTASEIALRYNDHAVLENYHVAQSFLVMKDPKLNILGNLSHEEFKYSRDLLIQMVLATDMAKHFEDVALFKANILPGPEEDLAIKSVGDKKLLLKMILHTCDVSNPAKDREIMLKWTDRVVEEFFIQGDLEKQLNLTVSPFMDRETIVLKKMQVGFLDFIVAPLFGVWAQILDNVDVVAYKTLQSNREFWSSLPDEFKPRHIKDVLRDMHLYNRPTQPYLATISDE